MAHVFVYLAVVADWSSLRVLSHRVSISMEADFCIEALEEALAKTPRNSARIRPFVWRTACT